MFVKRKNEYANIKQSAEALQTTPIRGTFFREGIYKIETPFRINLYQWGTDEANRGLAIIGCNYSEDYSECDAVYYTNGDYNALGNLVYELNNGGEGEYGFVQCIYTNEDYERIGEAIIL